VETETSKFKVGQTVIVINEDDERYRTQGLVQSVDLPDPADWVENEPNFNPDGAYAICVNFGNNDEVDYNYKDLVINIGVPELPEWFTSREDVSDIIRAHSQLKSVLPIHELLTNDAYRYVAQLSYTSNPKDSWLAGYFSDTYRLDHDVTEFGEDIFLWIYDKIKGKYVGTDLEPINGD
jgi:hypothetical protein